MFCSISMMLLLQFMISCGGEAPTANTNEPTTTTEKTTTEEEAPVKEKATPVVKEEATNSCQGSFTAYLADPDMSGTNVRKEPKGTVVYKIVRGDEEDEVTISFSESKNGWFKVTSIEEMEGKAEMDYSAAWIHGSVLGLNTSNYGGQTIKVNQEANATSATVKELTEETYNLSLVDFCGEWVKVKGKGFSGWINQEWLCSSTMTTCS